MVTKVRTQTSTDGGLLEECKKETRCDNCDITWTTPSKGTRIDPPATTLAIVVDVVHSQGAIRIFEKSDDEYVDGVGTEEAGNRVIVPWKSNWWFRASGSLQVGYIVGKQ